MTSVIVPAHDEAKVILRLLDGALADAAPDEFDVVVVCNGCTDDTAALARSRPGVRVVEIDAASKVAALNVGDRHARDFPRIYLDADIELSTQSLRLVRDALAEAPAAAPMPVVDTRGGSPLVRGYFAIWSRLGYTTSHVLGSGVYGLSESGRERFGEFPDLISDDGFVYCQFAPSERHNPPGASFTIRAPRTVATLVKRRVRIIAGNIELERKTGLQPQHDGPGWLSVVWHNPRLAFAAPFFVGVNTYASLAARRRARAGTAGPWSRDLSTRGSS
ncbi:glycosyltransferase family 2 protein [Jatrophihabitans sp. GAS493]|uniref:glycosyltransferase n=1 Tax=Jatrophihabitans sp. GAS493 TaxID=1907575 RepID=UPI0012FD3B27|nr:glycosyltransferase family 2 protein [Jatrophihabitans sp. GAS493]